MTRQERWAVAIGMLGLISTFGLARFIYTPLLPLMQSDLGFGDDWAGILASANYIGYLCGALGAMLMHSLASKQRLFKLAIVVAAVTNIGMGMIHNDTLWLIFRFLSGIASAGGMVIGSGLMLLAIAPRNTINAQGMHFAGVGTGIALGALWVLLLKDIQHWDTLWISSGWLILALGLPALFYKNWHINPERQALINARKATSISAIKVLVILLGIAYFCEGVGYIVSATFLVAILQKSATIPLLGDYAWLMVGLAAAPSCWLWAKLSQRIGLFHALIVAYLLQAIGIILPVFGSSIGLAIAGAILFGGTFMGIVSMVLAYGGKLAGARPTVLMGLLTACFGIAQIIGPAAAGYIAELQGNFDVPLIAASMIAMLGAMVTGIAKRYAPQD